MWEANLSETYDLQMIYIDYITTEALHNFHPIFLWETNISVTRKYLYLEKVITSCNILLTD